MVEQGPWGVPPRRRNTSALVLGGVGLFVVATLVGTGVGWLNANRSNANSLVIQSSTPTDSPSTALPPSDSPTPTPTPLPTPSEPTEAELEQQAYDALTEQAATDRRQIKLRGQWAAQLSSKYVGVRDPLQETALGSHTFYAADILAEHQDLRATFGAYDVILLRGQDFSPGMTHNGDTFWYTFVLGNFDSRNDVDYFCEGAFQGLTGKDLKNRCLPRTLRP